MKYNIDDIDFKKINTFSIHNRKSKVSLAQFCSLERWGDKGTIESILPSILKAEDIKEIVGKVVYAYNHNLPVVFAMGAHVIKCGLSPIIIDLVKRGIVTGIALNGAGVVHDYEIALTGATSEDVASELKNGKFGMAAETGDMINSALKKNTDSRTGMGYALAMDIKERDLSNKDMSILYSCYIQNIPVTVHVALGTDIIHLHPSTDAAVLGKATYRDFKLFCSVVRTINNGGCYFNIGSSVILPEVFLKALTVTRNLGYEVDNFITVNMDMIQHYRPNVNVVSRPHKGYGKGYSITGHHELMLPFLYLMIIERLNLR